MRKLFSFRSSAPSSGNSNPVIPPLNSEVYWETPWEGGVVNQVSGKVQDGSWSANDLGSGSGKQCPENQTSASGLRRSLSFSSPGIYSDLGERDVNCLCDGSRSPSTGSNAPHHVAEFPIRCLLVTPERQSKPKRGDHAATRKTHAVEKLDSPSSSRRYVGSSGNSPYSSPVPLRCRAARLNQVPKKILDLYIDGEQQERRPMNESRRNSHRAQNDGFSLENRMMPNSRWPPKVQTTAPSSPTGDKERLRSHSCRESRDTHLRLSARDWMRDDARPASPQKLAKNVVGRLCQVFPKKSKMKSREINSKTITQVEDIYEDSQPHPSMNSSTTTQGTSMSDHMSSCHISDVPYEITNGYCTKEISCFQKQDYFLGDGPVSIKHENSEHSMRKEEDPDVELRRKGKEAEERVALLLEELEQLKLRSNGFSLSALLQTIRNINDDRRNLALEVSAQIQSRIAERSSANEALNLAKVDLDTRTRRLEKEKQELQSSLEKELDRRSSDWSFKLEKYQSEEQRLRERVRELAEQNVSLQREVSSFSSREVETRNRIVHSEMQLSEVTVRMEETRAENDNLRQALLEVQERCRTSETDRDCIKRSYKEKEQETKELQKVVTRLQRTCGEQEKTITGLRQGLGSEITKQSSEKSDIVVKLQMEQVRLTGVEQTLRREVESFRLEVKSLRHENINLLNRLRGTGNGGALSSVKLDQELGARVDLLQNQCFSLLDENGQLCGNLLEFVKGRTCYPQVPHEHPGSEEGYEVNNGFDGYSVVEYDMKFQSFTRGVENLRRSLQTVSAVLQEKSDLNSSELQSQMSGPSVQKSEGNAEHELKAEILVTKVLREKMSCKEQELEQLQAELATAVRGNDILRCEIQRAQDATSSLTHKLKDLELQMLRKEENISQLQSDLQECMKELTITKGILSKVTEERDLMWEEVKQHRENNMLLNYEVNSMKKKMEALEDDVLIKEGQITILKDSIDKRPFDILYSSNSMQEFTTLQ
ncbi:uncharacterized protein LOC131226696 [Magnolia sinica]|uniref:uncharacterized protein LOC131226696 n=1 Tax=Magnolia sinica TaxID=86752 RepID=UPI002657D04A|nr:uncharacterized protein LOC131226696 [Magnolia sinica]